MPCIAGVGMYLSDRRVLHMLETGRIDEQKVRYLGASVDNRAYSTHYLIYVMDK